MGFQGWYGRSVVVTGGAGFLGSHVVDRLRAAGARVFVPRSADFDLRRLDAARDLFAQTRPEVVIHVAADGGGIGYMREHPASIGANNLLLNTSVLQAASEAGVSAFVGVSSACAYPRDAPVPMRETDLWKGLPESTNESYGISKRVMMALGQAFREQYGLNAIFPVPVNLYGPRDDFGPRRSHVVPALIRRFLDAKQKGLLEVGIWGTGRATRELLYVEDCAEAIVLAAEKLDRSEPFNLGTGQETTVAAIVEAVAAAVGYDGRFTWDPSQPDGQARKCLDTSRARDWLGWSASTPLAEGLRRTVAWYLEHGGAAAT
jgi:GDP-L-fucose synthase